MRRNLKIPIFFTLVFILLLAFSSCESEHAVTKTVMENVVEATCTAEGSYDSVKYCTVCEEELSREKIIVPAKGHTRQESTENIKLATCTKRGSYDLVERCTVCDRALSVRVMYTDALGAHELEDGVCVGCGAKESSAGLQFVLNNDKKSYTLCSVGTCTETDIVVDLYLNLPVVSMYPDVFSGNESITSVTLGEGIKSVTSSAFKNCTGITRVKLGSEVKSINDYAFKGCESLKELEIPDRVTQISRNAFEDCASLTSIVIPNSVTSLGDSAFKGCTKLTSVTVGRGVKNVYPNTFVGCTKLSKLTFKGEITGVSAETFRDTAFYNDKESWEDGFLYVGDILIGVSPSFSGECLVRYGTKSIASYAFKGCTAVTSIKVPSSVNFICEGAFSGCYMLESIELPFIGGSPNPNKINSSTVFGYVFGKKEYDGGIPTRQKYGDSYVEYYLPRKLKSVKITGGKVLYGAFSYCKSLQTIEIPQTQTEIPDYAFYGCELLKNFVVPYSVTRIGIEAFCGCERLSNLTLPERVLEICHDAFMLSYYYKEPSKWDNDVLYIGKFLIDVRVDKVGECVVKDGTLSIADYALSKCEKLTSVIVPDSVGYIGHNAFWGCRSLEKMTLPFIGREKNPDKNSVTVFGVIFGSGHHSGCVETKQYSSQTGYFTSYIPEGLKSVTITGGKIFYGAFSNCKALTSVTLGEKVTEIGERAFYGCNALTNVIIGKGVTKIGKEAFYNCNSLASISYEGTEGEWNAITKDTKWKHYSANFVIAYEYNE